MTNAEPIRIATRASALAITQSRQVASMLGRPFELVEISTRGDSYQGPLTAVGGKGLFTAELEAALREGRVLLAIHSSKDLPAQLPPDMALAAVPPREDARDALITLDGRGPADLPPGARVGTSSPRRAVQLRQLRPDVRTEPLRGNVDTRLRKLREGQYDAIVLAMAGLRRLGAYEQVAAMVHPLELEQCVPAAGQGAIAIECLASHAAALATAAAANDAEAMAALTGERKVVHELGASCLSALGVHLRRRGSLWQGLAMASDRQGRRVLRFALESGSADSAAAELARRLLDAGARELLADP